MLSKTEDNTLNQPIDLKNRPNIPTRHRALSPGEQLRRGDKVFHFDDNRWIKVGEELRGTTVPENTESGGNRYCRPIHPLAQDWYVDLREGKGEPAAIGGPCDPFDTLENARETIEKRAKEMDRGPFGIIRDHRGSPLFAYDPPEPPPASHYYARWPVSKPRGPDQPGSDGTNPPNDPIEQNAATKAGESMTAAEEPCETSTFLDVLDQLEQAVLDLLVEIRSLKNECMEM